MRRQESVAMRHANKHFRKKDQAKAGTPAWQEYLDQEDATRLKTARLRAERLARDATAAGAEMLLPQPNLTRGRSVSS